MPAPSLTHRSGFFAPEVPRPSRESCVSNKVLVRCSWSLARGLRGRVLPHIGIKGCHDDFRTGICSR
eukprot:scaffold2044_cov247-Pinguiococcus_pyrenoidosus.AAC.3